MAHLADLCKEKGNAAFKNGKFLEAEDLYTQGIQKYSRNPLIFTNRANTRLKLQRWDGAVDDALKSIELSGPNAQNYKAYYFLAQAQLALHHPHEALTSALSAYDFVLHPKTGTKTSSQDVALFSAFVLRCKKAKFAFRQRERERRRATVLGKAEELFEEARRRELGEVSALLESRRTGQVEASERNAEVEATFVKEVAELRSAFTTSDPKNHAPKEIPDHLVDMITFEPMHDPVITKNGHSYERATLYEHLKRSPTDPLTRDVLTINDLRSNFGLKAACDEFWENAGDWVTDW